MYAKLNQFTQILAHYLALFGFAGLLLLAIMVALDILLRFLFDYPLQGVNDVSAVIMAVVITACIPKCLLLKQNISIEVLGDASGPNGKQFLNAFASFVTGLFFIAMFANFIPYAASITQSGEKTWVLGWPVGPWWWAATALIGAAVLAQFVTFIDDVLILLKKTDVAPSETPDSII